MSFTRGSHGYSESAEKLASSSERKTFTLDDFNGNVSGSILNMGKNRKTLSTVSSPVLHCTNVISEQITPVGTVRAICREGEITVMRIGNSAYAITQGNTLVKISSDCFAGTQTTIFNAGGEYYATDETRILKIASDLSCSYISLSVPLVYTNLASSGTVSDMNETPSALSPFVDIRYKITSSTSKVTIPSTIAVDKIENMVWSANGNTIATSRYSLSKSNGVCTISLTNIASDITVRIKLGYSDDKTKIAKNTVDASTNAVLFSPISMNAIRETGDYEAVLCTAGYDKNLYVTKVNTFSKIEHGMTEKFNIDMVPTVALPYADGYMLFSDNRIMFIKVNFDGEHATIEKNIIRRDFGCDMPRSAATIDDKIFFGNTKGGIFYLDKFGYTEKDCSCQISEAIDSKLLSHEESELAGAVAAVTNTHYAITVGGDTYLWHFSDELPSNVTESVEKRGGYSWSELDFIDVSDYIFTEGEIIYYIGLTDGNVYKLDAAKYAADTDVIASHFESRDLNFGSDAEKVITRIKISALPADDLVVNVYYDGVQAKSSYTVSPLDFSTVCTYCVRPERHKCRSVRIKISGEKPFELESVSFEYFETGK